MPAPVFRAAYSPALSKAGKTSDHTDAAIIIPPDNPLRYGSQSEYFFSGTKHAASAPETVIAKIKNKLKTIAAKLPITLLFRTS